MTDDGKSFPVAGNPIVIPLELTTYYLSLLELQMDQIFSKRQVLVVLDQYVFGPEENCMFPFLWLEDKGNNPSRVDERFRDYAIR